MKLETLFLRAVVFLIGMPILGLCIFWLPGFAQHYAEWLPELAYLRYYVVTFFYLTAMPFFVALYQALRLLGFIDMKKAFSELSVRALKAIKLCAIAISILYVAAMPLFYLTADLDDAPGLILIGVAIAFISFVVAVFAAMLQKLLGNAMALIKNDL